MALLDDNQNAAVDRLLGYRSSRGLRRTLRGFGSAGSDQLIEAAGQDVDPTRFRYAFRDRLRNLAATGQTAQALNDRDQIEQQLNNPDLTFDQRDLLKRKLDQLPKFGSIAERFDPRSDLSVASRFGGRSSLFRSL